MCASWYEENAPSVLTGGRAPRVQPSFWRGIAVGVVLVTPFWLLVAYAAWKLA